MYNGDSLTPAGGRDYFTRIREGESLFERIDLCTFLGTNTFAVTNCSMELVGDHTWRYSYHMETNLVNAGETLGFWFRGINKQTPGQSAYAVNTNDWFLKEAVAEIPYMPFSSVANGEARGRIAFDRESTHLVFEFNDETGAFTISHGGHQDFNAWTDANGAQYVGNYVTTSGVSDVKALYTCALNDWRLSMGTNIWWSENFGAGGTGGDKYPFDKHFDTMKTPNRWQATQGMFVSTDYTNKTENLATNSRALQMDGGGIGSIELSDLTDENVPKGIDTFTLKARVAQRSSFNAFTYSFDHMTKQNYAFSSQVAMSTVQNGTDMSPGTPSVSLVANYKPTKGCYEFRIRRLTKTRMELSLWKWRQNANGTGMECVPMMTNGTAKADGAVPTTPTKNPLITASDSTNPKGDYTSFSNYMVPSSAKDEDCFQKWTTCYISVYVADGVAHVVGAMAKTANKNGATAYKDPLNNNQSAEAESNFVYIYCKDSDSPLSKGTCGVGSTDCKAYFGQLQLHPVTGGTKVDREADNATKVETDDEDSWASWTAGNDNFNRTWTTIADNVREGSQWVYGLKSLIPVAQLEFFTREPGSDSATGWMSRGVTNVASFNMEQIVFQPRLTDSCYVRLATAGNDEAGTAVVVDDLAIRQWRGETDPYLSTVGSPDSWTYTEAWVTSNKTSKTERALLLQPKRGSGKMPMGLRSPWLKNGLSMISFRYADADENAAICIQVATNNVSGGRILNLTKTLSEVEWTTLTNISFKAMSQEQRKEGSISYSMSLRAPVSGLIRVIADPAVVSAATNAALPDVYGQVKLVSALCYDEPMLDDRAWWGWNLRTTGWDSGNANEFAYLTDWDAGLSVGLNWSGTPGDNRAGADLKDAEQGQYAQHDPFIQSPPMPSGIGNVSFRARMMYGSTQDVASVVCLTAAADKDAPDDQWTTLTNFTVTCPTYQTFSWKTTMDESPYKVIRLSVPGVKDGRDKAQVVSPGQRVLIDEVSMAEPVAPKIAFVDLAPFRTNLGDADMVVTNATSMDQQPLLGESWGVQVGLEAQQMSDDLDMDHIRVYFSYHVGKDKWGIDNWKDYEKEVELQRVGTNLVFRSCHKIPESIVPPQEGASVVVQYCVTVKYWDKNQDVFHDAPHTHRVTSAEWSMPPWYRGRNGDLNALYGANLDDRFSPYTILESISPRRAWINEINMYDGLSATLVNLGETNQFVEIAAPAGSDLKGWWLELINRGKMSSELAVFGSGGVSSTKTVNATNRYSFVTVCSPKTKTAKTLTGSEVDGTWNANIGGRTDGLLAHNEPYALRLVRPSGIWEHEVVFAATNTSSSRNNYMYEPTNLCENLNAVGGRFLVAGKDCDAGTLGVFRSHGENGVYPDEKWQDVRNCSWTNSMVHTPGRVNVLADGTLQDVDENYYIVPNGTNVWIYADVSGGHVVQKFGTNYVESAVIVLPMENSTNIVYVLDRWYEIASITTNGIEVPNLPSVLRKIDSTNVVFDLKNVNAGLSVVAKAGPISGVPAIDDKVKNSPYRDAVLDWLGKNGTSDQEIKLAEYWDLANVKQGDLDLIDMYWLDIDPFGGNWVLRAGMGSPDGSAVEKHEVTTSEGEPATNVYVRVTMMITNTVSGITYAPDRIQGLEPGSTSYDGTNIYNGANNWTSATFKVTGALQYGSVTNRWVPLRWFVFGPDSFDANYSAKIEIRDPFMSDSPILIEGWNVHRDCPVFYRWALDDRLRPDTTELLNSNSVFKTVSP